MPSASVVLEAIGDGERRCDHNDPFTVVFVPFAFTARTQAFQAGRTLFIALDPTGSERGQSAFVQVVTREPLGHGGTYLHV
jgi:hypothetical protein